MPAIPANLRYASFAPTAGCALLLAVWTSPPTLAKDVPANASKATDDSDVAAAPTRHAFKLGEFRMKNYRPVEREKVTLEFTIYVEVEDGNEQKFERVWTHCEHRVRNQILTSARLVPPHEFDDPTLHALRRRIYLRLRRAVPELPVGEVFVSDFSYMVE